MVPLHNDTDQLQFIEPGERIAQLVIMPYLSVEFEESDTLSETQRGTGGFGSTGAV
jgi:dUTP pyrophosphatase